MIEEPHLRQIQQKMYDLRMAFARAQIPCPDILGYSDPGKYNDAIEHLRNIDMATLAYIGPDGPAVEMMGYTVRFIEGGTVNQ